MDTQYVKLAMKLTFETNIYLIISGSKYKITSDRLYFLKIILVYLILIIWLVT